MKKELRNKAQIILNDTKNINIVMLDQTFVSGMNFITGILLAKYLGLYEYGKYVLAFSVLLFASTIQVSMLVAPMMVVGPTKYGDEKNAYFTSLTIQNILLCIIIIIIVLIGGKVISLYSDKLQYESILWSIVAAIMFFLIQDYFRRYFFSVDRPLSALLNDLVSYGLQVLAIFIWGMNAEIKAGDALMIVALTSAVAVSVAIMQTKKIVVWKLPAKGFLIESIKYNYDFGKWLLGGNVVAWGQAQFISYFCGIMISISIVGALNASRNIIGFVNVLFMGIMNFLPPRAALIFSKSGVTALTDYLKKASLWGGLITILIIFPCIIWSEELLSFVYGAEYRGYGWIVTWWGIYSFIGFFHRPISVGLNVLKQTRSIFISNLIGFVFILMTSYPLYRVLGCGGLLLGMCIGNALILYILFIALTSRRSKPATFRL